MRRLAAMLCLAGSLLPSVQAETRIVPLALPRPDGRPGDPDKPVQVYILAGQSNMVGIGEIRGARPYYRTVFLPADPAVIPGRFQQDHALRRLRIYPAADPRAAEGATFAVYAGAFDPEADLESRTPVATGTVALGVFTEALPSVDGPHTVVVDAYIEAPATGTYTLHPGYDASTYAIARLNGETVYRREPGGEPDIRKVDLAAGRHPVRITYLRGGSAAFWMRQVDIPGRGDLETITRVDGLFPYLLDAQGDWTVRNDVTFRDIRLGADRSGPLSPTSNGGRTIGPELGFGHVLGAYRDAQVLLLKSAQGNRSLGFDFRPPSSGRLDPDNEQEGYEYRRMIEGVREALAEIADVVPGYRGQGYEIAGFGWWQGHADRFTPEHQAAYEENLVNLIRDVRAEFDAPDLPVVVATVGFGGYGLQPQFQGIFDAQMAVSDPQRHPDLAGTVASVDTRDFAREVRASPRAEGHHYHRNAETYMLVGEAMGRAMVRLHGGEAEPIPIAGPPEASDPTPRPEPTEAERAAAQAALRPIVRHGLAPEYIARHRETLARAWEAPDDRVAAALDGLADLYREIGDHAYDWQPHGPHRTEMEWDFHTFDPVEQPPPGQERARLGRAREVTYPAGMEDWHRPEFDAAAAGWRRGRAPFASMNGELRPAGDCRNGFCGCGEPPHALWENEVLLIRGFFDIPPFEEGHIYRILVGGMSHVGAGDGTWVYVNGEPIYERGGAVDRRQGGRPIGAVIPRARWPEFAEGRVHLAAKSFLKYYPRSDVYGNYLTIFLQRMRIPPMDLDGE